MTHKPTPNDMKKSILLLALLATTFNQGNIMAQEKITQTAGHVQLGEFAPKFAELNDDVLFGEVWNRPGLSPRDRSMITVSNTHRQRHHRLVTDAPLAIRQAKRHHPHRNL